MCESPKKLLKTVDKIQQMMEFQKKLEKDKYRKKSSFLQDVLRHLVKENQINVDNLPRDLVKQDKFNVLKDLRSIKPDAGVKLQRRDSKDHKKHGKDRGKDQGRKSNPLNV
jgi:hypothetical protein